jgi:hypothetical protein
MAQLKLSNQQIVDALASANLCPFSGQLKDSRNLVNSICKSKWAASDIRGNKWALYTAKRYQFIEITFSDVQGCGFDSRPISQ